MSSEKLSLEVKAFLEAEKVKELTLEPLSFCISELACFFILYLLTAYCNTENVWPHSKENLEPMKTLTTIEYFRVHFGGGGDF